LTLAAAAMAALCGTPTVLAQDRTGIAVTLTVQFDGQGRFAALRQKWTFDDAYSARLLAALDTDRDGGLDTSEMSSVASGDLAWMAREGFFTRITQGGAVMAVTPANDLTGAFVHGRFSATFTLPLVAPRALALERIVVSDPGGAFNIVFDYPDVTSEGAPSYCRVRRVSTALPAVEAEADCR
jgi:ABC-type uncharacterized transport system substrate-binding protein